MQIDNPDVSRRSWIIQAVCLAGILCLAAALRIYHLGGASLWLDEAYTYRFARIEWRELLFHLSSYETHPPLYYSLIKLWTGLFGYSEFVLRFPSVIGNLLSIPFVYFSARFVSTPPYKNKMGLLAALIFSLFVLQIGQAQNARPYTFLTLAYAMSCFSVCWLWSKRESLRHLSASHTRNRSSIIVYITLAVGISLLQWFHNTSATFILSLTIVLLWFWWITCNKNRILFIHLVATGILALALYAPYIPQFYAQITSFADDGFWLKEPTLSYFALSTMVLFGPIPHWMPIYIQATFFLMGYIPLIMCGILSFVKMHKSHPQTDNPLWLLLMLCMLPWVINLAITFMLRPIYMERVLVPLQVPWAIFIAAIPFAFDGWKKNICMAFLISVSFLCASQLFASPQHDTLKNEDWRQLAQMIVDEKDTTPQIITLSDFPTLPLEYYGDRMGFKPHFTIVPKDQISRLTRDDIRTLLSRQRDQKIIWVSFNYPHNQHPALLIEELSKTHYFANEDHYNPQHENSLLEFKRK